MIPQILIPIPPGELFDRISILKLKVARAKNILQRENFALELEKLLSLANLLPCPFRKRSRNAHLLPKSTDLAEYLKDLDQFNAILWDVEDQLRLLERKQSFGTEFIQLARSVYRTNDRRCELKRQA